MILWALIKAIEILAIIAVIEILKLGAGCCKAFRKNAVKNFKEGKRGRQVWIVEEDEDEEE